MVQRLYLPESIKIQQNVGMDLGEFGRVRVKELSEASKCMKLAYFS